MEGLTGSSSWDGSGGGWVDDCSTSPWAPAGIPNLDWYALISSSYEGSFPELYTSFGLVTPGFSFLTIIALIGCIQASLSSKGTPACLHRRGARDSFFIFVIEDYILYNLADIKWDVLDDGIVEQGPLGRHFSYIGRWDEMRCDEVMPYLRNVGQVFFLEVHCVPFTVQFPLSLPVGQHPKDFGIVKVFMELIIGFRVNRVKVIVSIDSFRTKVYQHLMHLDPFQYVGG